jgi:hypothetical protein
MGENPKGKLKSKSQEKRLKGLVIQGVVAIGIGVALLILFTSSII